MKLPLADLGQESEKGVVSALNDLFGPSFREVGEYLADKVRYHRVRSLSNIVREAKRLGEDKNLNFTLPSSKFLVSFIEEASLEESDDEEMCSLWAKLLVQASSSKGSENYLFKRIIRDMTAKEARLLKALVCESRGGTERVGFRLGYSWHHHDTRFNFKEEYLQRILTESINDVANYSEISAAIIDRLEGPGSHIDYVSIAEGRRGVWPVNEIEGDEISGRLTKLYTEYENSFYVLEGLNIVTHYKSGPIWSGSVLMETHIYHLNDLGCAFYDACVGVDAEKK